MNGFFSHYVHLALLMSQVLLISLGVLILQYYRVLDGQAAILYSSVFIIFSYFTAVVLLRKLFQAEYQDKIIVNQEATLQRTESLLRLIRSQRHDIINHLHAIYALLQMGKDNQAKKYINEFELEISPSPIMVHRLKRTGMRRFSSQNFRPRAGKRIGTCYC